MLQQARPELAQDAVIEARVGQVQGQKVLPVNPCPHRLCGLPVGQVLAELHQRDQRQPPRRISRLAEGGVEVIENGTIEDRAKPVAQEQVGIAARERRSADGLCLRRDSRDRAMWAQGHGCHSYQSRTLNARSLPGSDFANSVRSFLSRPRWLSSNKGLTRTEP